MAISTDICQSLPELERSRVVIQCMEDLRDVGKEGVDMRGVTRQANLHSIYTCCLSQAGTPPDNSNITIIVLAQSIHLYGVGHTVALVGLSVGAAASSHKPAEAPAPMHAAELGEHRGCHTPAWHHCCPPCTSAPPSCRTDTSGSGPAQSRCAIVLLHCRLQQPAQLEQGPSRRST